MVPPPPHFPYYLGFKIQDPEKQLLESTGASEFWATAHSVRHPLEISALQAFPDRQRTAEKLTLLGNDWVFLWDRNIAW